MSSSDDNWNKNGSRLGASPDPRRDAEAAELGGTGQAPNLQNLGETNQAPNRQDLGGTGQAPNLQNLGETGQAPNLQNLGETNQAPNRQDLGGTGQAPNRQDLGGTEQAPNLQEISIEEALRFNASLNLEAARVLAIQRQLGLFADGRLGSVELALALYAYQSGQPSLQADGKLSLATLSNLEAQPEWPFERQAQVLGPDAISAHFRWEQFRSTGDNQSVPEAMRGNVRLLCEQLEQLVDALGARPMRILSGWRSEWWNHRLGASPKSLHLQGLAADFVVEGVRPSRVRQALESLIEQGRIRDGGIGRYATYTHYDLREASARWNG
ncbi:MAG: D-Ala-D-Ala carboxypeptidase family metallohydrolase [Myxococcota bacterium]|jgi:hypothetical protein|nr:D-Ala-D-Ala carboxypeptidase family metallohydrolase [Myxococcota bacterium]